MIIDTDEYVTVKEFAEKVGKTPQYIRHYILNKTLKAVQIRGFWFIHIDCFKSWSPAPKKLGRPRSTDSLKE